MSKLDEAISFAAIAHAGQLRKYIHLPYIIHPLEVMTITAIEGGLAHDENALIAAVLHDVVEDTPVGIDTIQRRFGEDASGLVTELTEVEVPGNRKVRKAAEVVRIANISDRGQTIKLADLISNTASIVRYDPGFARTYLREKAELLLVLTRGERRLYDLATAQLERAWTLLEIRDDCPTHAAREAGRTA